MLFLWSFILNLFGILVYIKEKKVYNYIVNVYFNY